MTEFKYCVHCENEPAVCFDTEVDAMKFARDCTDTCSCIKVEKSEIGEDGEILNNEVIWTADSDGDIEKEAVTDNEFDMEFPVSDIENIDISDDIDYDEIARQYKEDQTDWVDDSKLIKEAVDAMEENESEVECKCCFDVFPKESCIKTEKGYICKKCNQELHSHQGTNLDLIDSDPFSLDYEDPRDFDEPEEIEVKDEPVDANEVRKHEKSINEELKVIIDFSDYKPWSGAVDTYELIKDADKLDELEAYFEELYPDGITATQINDILWFNGKEVLKYLGLGDAEDEEIDESIKEHINDRPADIESDQEYQGVDNAVVDCKKYTVVAHSEDEKPVDCKLEKPALGEPLAGKEVDVKLNEAKEDDELPVDPEAAKLEVHTMLNDLVADEIEAINGYDDAKAQIIDTPIEHKDNILDTIDHIKGEEQEHIDELIGATTEIPFDKEETHDSAVEEAPLAEETHAQYAKPEGDRVAAYNNALKYAKKENKPFIYGYTNRTGKFFAAETPMKVKGSPADAEKEFRSRYKNCNVVYVAYPDKDFIDEALTEDVLTEFTPIAPHPVLYKEIDKAYGNNGGFLVTKRRKGKNESEAAKKTNSIKEAVKFVKELAKNKDIAEIHLQIVKTSKDILIYKDGKETFNKIVEVGKNLQAENKTKVGGDTISDIDELRDATKKDLEKLFADIANNYKEAEQEQIKEILQDYAKKLRACTTKDEIALLDAVNKAKTDISKLKTKAEYEAEETTNKDTSSEETVDKESNDTASTDNTTSTTKIKTDAAAAALKNAYPNNDKQIRIVLSMLKKANLTEDIDENLEEDKKDDKLPADPEAAKLEVHTMLNDLVADEIEAINGYDDAKAEIMSTPIEHKDNILDTIDHIKGEEQEHIDELIDATTEIPFDKEEEIATPEVEEPFNQDFPEVDEEPEEKSLTETKAKPEGDKVKSYNDGLKLAKLHSKPVIYGYTNSSYGNKFFALDDPIVCNNVSDETKKFRRQYKSCNVVYVAYPDDQFVED